MYISIDVDVFDPKIAPGVNYPEENGMSKEIFFELLKKIKKEIKIQTYDLVEVTLEKDVDKKTLLLAQKILEEIIRQ